MAINNLNYNKVSMNCWYWFMQNHQEELYEIIKAMIEIKVNELLPQLVKEELRQSIDNLPVSINATINGNAATSKALNDAIIDAIKSQFS